MLQQPRTSSPPEIELARQFGQGIALERAGRLIEARLVFRAILQRHPGNVDALTHLGLLEIRCNDPYAAVAPFEEAVKRAPKSAPLRNNLAMLYLSIGRPDKAEPHALRSHKLEPNSAETLKILFECANELGQGERARAFIEKALTLRPDDPALTLDLAQSLDTTGERDRAQLLYRKLIDAGQSLSYAYDGIARLQTYSDEPPEYAEIERRLVNGATSPGERQQLHGTLGKIDRDLGRTDSAFAHFSAMRSPARAADQVKAFSSEMTAFREIFSPAFFSERRDFANPSVRPIFVVGMPRSGTTLVEQILSSHPEIHGAGELRFFEAEQTRVFGRDQSSRRFADAVRAWPQAAARDVGQDYLNLLAAHSPHAARIVDKMPHNFERLWLLALLFPNARFVHCRREPIANCVSCFTVPLGEIHAYTDDLAALGHYYRLYHELMAFWRATLPVRILDIQYEQLVADTEGESRRLVAHVGLEWDASCLRFYETKRPVHTPSRRQVDRPIYQSSVAGWRRYEKHLGPLIEALGDLAPKPSS